MSKSTPDAADQYLQEIADGAWGDGPHLRGLARDDLNRRAPVKPAFSWTETKPGRWQYGSATVRQAKRLRGFLVWMAFFADGRERSGDSLEDVKAYVEARLAAPAE